MKLPALVLSVVAFGSGPLFGALVFSEDFAYSDGSLAGLNGGTGFTNAWGEGNFTVAGGAAYSNPNTTTQTSTQTRAFSGFSETSFTFSLDYNILLNNEGSYDFQIALWDSNGQEIFSLGNRNNATSPGSEDYVARIGTGGGAGFQLAKQIATDTFNDTVTVDFSFSGASLTATINSATHPELNGSLNRTLGNAIDFSSGGTLVVQKSDLDSMGISVDNISLTSIPEPSVFGLVLAAAGLCGLRRRR